MSDVYVLDLDWDVIQHLAVPESVTEMRRENLDVELLEDPLAVKAFEFQMLHVAKHGTPASASVLENEFDQVTIDQPQTVIGDLIDRLRRRYARNHAMTGIKNLAKASQEKEASEYAKELSTEAARITRLLTAKGKTYTEQDFDRSLDRYHKLVAAGRQASLGFDELDDHFYGQLGLTFAVGAPKGFKSWVTVKSVQKNIMDDKMPFLYSLELPAEETDMRLRCMTAGVPWWRYVHRQLDKQDIEQLRDASEILADRGGYRIEKPPQGERTVARMIEHARDQGADVIYMDQLQYIENRKGVSIGATNDTKDYFEVINDMRDYSDQGPIWCVHQFNRTIMNADKMPDMQQIKASSAVEECATLVLGLWATKQMRQSGILQIGTLAARNAGLETWEAQVLMRSGCNISINGVWTDDGEA